MLQNVVVGYTPTKDYQTWEGGMHVPSYEYWVGDEMVARIYWDYTNGGTYRYISTSVRCCGETAYVGDRYEMCGKWFGQVVSLLLMIEAAVITKTEARQEARRLEEVRALRPGALEIAEYEIKHLR